MLAMVVFAVTDERNSEAPPGGLLPRQESFASLHILTRRASEGSEALPSLARRVRMSFFGARVIAPVFISLTVSALISVIAPTLGATIGSGLYVHVLRTPNPAGDDKDASLHG